MSNTRSWDTGMEQTLPLSLQKEPTLPTPGVKCQPAERRGNASLLSKATQSAVLCSGRDRRPI